MSARQPAPRVLTTTADSADPAPPPASMTPKTGETEATSSAPASADSLESPQPRTEPLKTRQQLMEECQGLVRSLAWQIHSRLAKNADLDDLIAYGQIGLAEAARDYDRERGGKFSTFAYYRIRGAIYDGLSKMSWFSRAQYRRLKFQRQANELLSVDAESSPPGETSTMAEDVHWLKRVASGLAVARLAIESDDETSRVGSAPDHRTESPSDVVIGEEIRQVLRGLVDALPPEAANLIRGAYFEGLTLQEAGARIGISKAWASRLHARTLERLARSLRQRDLDD